MLFFKRKEEMGLDACLRLLDLTPDATIDDANQAYATLHRMIDRFHRDGGADARVERQADMELLTCAYEKAISHLSDAGSGGLRPEGDDAADSRDLHFTINFSPADEEPADPAPADAPPPPDGRTVEAAVAITARRLKDAESQLQGAHQAVAAAAEAVDAAARRHDRARQARITAAVDAKSARTRALLLEVDANRAMQEAIAIAEKARDRVVAARRTAGAARQEADRAREAVTRMRQSEETAAAETVCAEDALEKATARLKALTHLVLEARERVQLFRDFGADPDAPGGADGGRPADRSDDRQSVARQRIISDLTALEASLNQRKQPPRPEDPPAAALAGVDCDGDSDRRRHVRLSYPVDRRPHFIAEGRAIPILDLSCGGMALAPDDRVAASRLVRGEIEFQAGRTLTVAGRVVRSSERHLGLRLVTRIGNHILDQERRRLSA